jgi:hypothetical protein
MKQENYWRDKFRELLEKHVALSERFLKEKKSTKIKNKSKPSKGTDEPGK